MKQDLLIGSAPSKEPYTLIRHLEDYWRAWHECQAFIDQIRRTLGWSPLDFNPHIVFDVRHSCERLEVVYTFESDDGHAVTYARKLRDAVPSTWDAEATVYLASDKVAPPTTVKGPRQHQALNDRASRMTTKFALGHVVTTCVALREMIVAGQDPMTLLRRHGEGDWGDVDRAYKTSNDEALIRGDYLISSHLLGTGVEIWIVTGPDRSLTMLLLPDEYCS